MAEFSVNEVHRRWRAVSDARSEYFASVKAMIPAGSTIVFTLGSEPETGITSGDFYVQDDLLYAKLNSDLQQYQNHGVNVLRIDFVTPDPSTSKVALMPEQTKPSTAIEGRVVWEDECQGALFQLEELIEPRVVGAGARPYRLWCDGRPATGGQWQYTIEGAKAEAARRADHDLYSQIARLRLRVANLERQLYEATK